MTMDGPSTLKSTYYKHSKNTSTLQNVTYVCEASPNVYIIITEQWEHL